jgi:integrase
MKRTTVKISLDTSKSSQYSDGTYPVVIQIGHNRKVFRKRIGLRATPQEWDNERYVSDGRVVRNYKERNNELNELEYKANQIVSQHFTSHFDYKKFSSLLEKQDEAQLRFKDVCDRYVEELYDQGRAGTAKYYEDVGASVENYEEGVLLLDINKEWVRNYVKHYARKGTKAISYLRGMKALFGVAMNEYDLDYDIMPFKTAYNPKGYDLSEAKKIKIIKQEPLNGKRIECLSIEQMETLKAYQPNNQGKQRAYDIFMFSYYTGGVNAKDIALMKYDDIINGLWFYEREKTSEGGQGKPLTEKALEIIEKYRSDSKYVFPWILSGYDQSERIIKARMSSYLSNLRRRYTSISKECGFNGHISIYTARTTAATILVNKGANLKAVQTALDHSNIAMTSQYIRGVENSVMKETLEML